MEDEFCEEPEPPPFQQVEDDKKLLKQDKKPPPKKGTDITISESAKKKITGLPKKSRLNELEEKMRDKERQIEEEHTRNWYLGEEYLGELQHRLETNFRVAPPDPYVNNVYKCYQQNREDPMKCRDTGHLLRKAVEEKQLRFVEKARKIVIEEKGKSSK